MRIANLELALAPGSYTAEFIDPVTRRKVFTTVLQAGDEPTRLSAANDRFREDLAIAIRRK